jgi:hypothetical protein
VDREGRNRYIGRKGMRRGSEEGIEREERRKREEKERIGTHE